MAQHFEIDPDQNGIALKIASRALDVANGQSTARPGSIYIPNGDGTGTLIGSQAGTDSTGSPVGVAPWVGDTTPPGKPTGITCKTSWGSLYVEWDGTLEGGIPSDFSHTSVLVNDVEIGQMTGSGTLVQNGYSNGETLQVTAVAYDSAHDRVGNLAPNASEAFGPVEVVISDEKAEIDADVAEIQKKADQASKDAAAASSKADALQGEVSDVKTTINGVETELNGLSTKVEGAVSNANEALTTATEAKQTATEVKTTADRAYENAEEAIKQSSTAVQTATEVKTTLETNYQTKSDADASYASKSDLSQTSESIRSEVSRTYQPKGDYATNAQLGSYAEKSYVDQKAGEITSAVESTYVSKTDASKTYATKTEVKQETDSIRSTVSEVQTTADSALEKASTVEQTASGITVRLDQTVKNVSAAQSAADAAADAASSAQSTANAANTAAGKAQTTANSASTAAANAQSTANAASTAANNAAKTATNYLSFDSSGLTVGNVAGTLQGNTHLTSDSVEVRNGTTVLSRFKSTLVELGLNARNAVIKMCGGLLSISGSTDSGSGEITIFANKLSSDPSSPKLFLRTGGTYQTEMRFSSEDNLLTPSLGNVGNKGWAILTSSIFRVNNGSRTIELSENYGDLKLINATNRDPSFPAKWIKRGGWMCLQGRVKVSSANAQIANIKSLVDSMALPPSGVNRNFCCIGLDNNGALVVYNVYMGSDGILRAGAGNAYGSNSFIDLSGVIIMSGVS